MFSFFRLSKKNFDQYGQLLVLLLLVMLVAASLVFFREVMLPFFLAMFLAYLLAPVIDWLSARKVRGRRVPRGLSIIMVYLVIFGLLVLSGFYLFPRLYIEVNKMVKTIPKVLHDMEENVIVPFETNLNTWLSEVLPPPDTSQIGSEDEEVAPFPGGMPPDTALEASPSANRANPLQPLLDDYAYRIDRVGENSFIITPQRRAKEHVENGRQPFRFNQQFSGAFRQFRASLESNVVEFIALGRAFIRALLGSFFMLFMVLMICGFILLDPGRINQFMCTLIPDEYHGAYQDWVRRMDMGLSGVVRGQALICLINGIMTGIGVGILGVPFVITLSVIAAIFSLIPIFGVLISTIPILLMALTVSFTTAILALGWILVIHFFEGNMLNPKILGDSAKIHPVLVVFALVVGEHFAGVMGALLAVPIFSIVQNSFLFLMMKADHGDPET